ncbi:MAG: hypothetical protein ACT4TC_13775 [Myxococcaceae bacterium]
MALFIKLLLFFFCGGAFGNLVASMIAPRFLVWDNTTRTGMNMCSCIETVRDTTGAMLRYQLVGTVIGGVAALALGIVIQLKWRAKPPTTPGLP